MDELNEWSDLKVLYYPVKTKDEKKSVEKIAFEIHTQEPKIQQQELSAQEEMDILVSQLIEEKSVAAYEKARKYTNIADKSAFINSIIRKFDREDIESEIRLMRWLDYTKDEFKPNTNQPALLCIDPYGKKEMITITNEYGLYDVLSQRLIARKPSTALKKINGWIEKGAMDVEFKALGRIYDEFLVSYINLLPS